MTIFIVTCEIGQTYGAFTTENAARCQIDILYKNGYFGALQVQEDALHGDETPSYEELALALNTLRLARKESSQAMLRASYHKPVQPIFDALETKDA